MKSIQRRLSLGLIAVLLVVGLIVAQTGLWLFDRELREYLAADLREETQSLLSTLERSMEGVILDERRLDPAFRRQFSGRYFHIHLGEQSWRSRSLWDRRLDQPGAPGMQAELADGPQGQRLLVYRADYRRFGQPVIITVAQDYGPILTSFKRMAWVALGLGITALLVILLAQRYTVRRAFKPLEQVRKQVEQLQQGERSGLDEQVPMELEPLVRQINHLLVHTEQILKRSRNALGNLGHALKTPLAVLVSLGAREELNAYPKLRDSLNEQLEQIQQRLGRELNQARLAGDVLPGARFNCDQELPSLFSTLAMIHDRSLKMTRKAPKKLILPWDREDMLELLGNLLDNACKWAGSQVSLEITRVDSGYQLTVDDDGPGIEQDRRNDVLNRGIRLDEQVKGHGLGLGIARDIVEAWGGRIELQESPLGGLRVSIHLPEH